ncbi:hypothetical protein [Haloplanus salilacus]|uniref:hypothetical protein n=1 Tax=Haloplanus salilacus TaxID=2949994 RepID=UPI0030CC9D7C
MMPPPVPPVEVDGDAEGLADTLADSDGTVAVVSDPFFDREAVLDHARSALDATRVRLGPAAETGSVPGFDDGPVVVDDCHHLYARRVGGFDPIDRVLDRLASSSCRVVTSWNRYSWNYLCAVRELDDAFRHVVTLPSLSAERIGATIRDREGALPAFEHPPGEQAPPVTTATYEVPIPRRDPASIRLPVVDVDYVAAWLGDRDRPGPEELVFQRLARLSNGNPGVAAAVWDACVDGDAVTPTDLDLPVERADPGDDAATVLGVVVAKGAVTREELRAVVPGVSLDRTLGTLVDRGFVETGGAVTLCPNGLPSALALLDRRRWLW